MNVEQKILELLSTKDMTTTEIAFNVGTNYYHTLYILSKMKDKGLVNCFEIEFKKKKVRIWNKVEKVDVNEEDK